MKKTILNPTNNQKSFYGKAYTLTDAEGVEILYSYNTPILKRFPNGEIVRLWSGWSLTTGKHIKAFCGMNKKEYDNLKTA